MNNLLNTIAHQTLRLLAKQVRRTDAERTAQLNRSLEIGREITEWRGKESATVVSLGQNCSTAWYIKAAGLKLASYPFDWVASSPDIIMHCIKDRFTTFLDREQMVSRGVRAGHSFYHSGFFGHRNPHSSQADHDYYVRCVKRFQNLMGSQQPVIFVSTVLNEHAKRPVWADGFVNAFHRPEHQTLEDFQGMMETIRAINPQSRFLFIEEYTEQTFSLEMLHRSDDVLWLKNCAMGSSTGVQFLDGVDDAVARNVYSALAEPQG